MTNAASSEDRDNDAAPDASLDAEKSLLPTDAAGWRAYFAEMPHRDLLRAIQADKDRAARIFAGFRPGIDTLRNPVVRQRVVEEATKQPLFVEEIGKIAAAPIPRPLPPLMGEGVSNIPTPVPSAMVPTITSGTPSPINGGRGRGMGADTSPAPALKETIKKQRAALKEKDARIKVLEAALAGAKRERDAARTDKDTERTARQSAEAEAQRERRQRERAERREIPATPVAAVAAPPKAPVQPTPVPSQADGLPLEAVLERLLVRGKPALVAEVCREALKAESASSHRGGVHSLYAAALYAQGEIAQAEEQDRLAIAALLNGSRIREAAEAMARLLAQGATLRAQGDGALLLRLQQIAEKMGMTPTVQDTFQHMQISMPEGRKRLRALLEKSGKQGQSLLSAVNAPPAFRIGPETSVALPTVHPAASSVSARAIIRAIDGGDAEYIFAVRTALQTLQNTNKPLVIALQTAVAGLLPDAVTALQYETRPVVVDASNVARADPDPLSLSKTPRVARLMKMRDYLLRQRFFPIILIADATLRYHVDDLPAYKGLIARHIIREASPGTSADEELIQQARMHHAILVTNDRLAEWEQSEDVERREFVVTPQGINLYSL